MFGLSIIVTFYNGEKFIYNCIDTLLKSYSNSNKRLNFEIIVVIDSLQDAVLFEKSLTERYIQHPLIVIRNSSNLGVAKSRNKGLLNSKYCFFTVIDQDDYVEREYFSTLERNLDTHIPFYLLNGHVHYTINGVKLPVFYFRPTFNFKRLVLKQTIVYTPGLLVFNSNFISKEHLFIDASEKYKGCDDWAAYLNMLIKFQINDSYKFIDRPIFVYTLHSENYSHNKAEMINSSRAVLDFISISHHLNYKMCNYIKQSRKQLDFEFAKDVNRWGAWSLLRNYNIKFIQHYVFSFFNRDRLNRIIFQVLYRMSRLSKRITTL
jgi:glycosyltransferase involved in cell wall biosynthesis